MEKKIKIPEYNNVLDNSLFAKDWKEIEHPILPIKVPFMDLLFLSTYSVPTQNQVVRYIQNSIRGLELITTIKDDLDKEWYEALSESFKNIPEGESVKIAKGDKKSISHLESHCEFEEDIPGQKYLCVLRRKLPSLVLEDFIETYSSKGPFLLINFLNNISSESNSFYLKLNKDGSLINEKELNHLLEIGVRDSDLLRIKCDRENYSSAIDNIKLIYSILNSSDNMKYLKDYSKGFLINSAVKTWANYCSCLSNGLIMEKISKKVLGGLGLGNDDLSKSHKKNKGMDFFNKNFDN